MAWASPKVRAEDKHTNADQTSSLNPRDAIVPLIPQLRAFARSLSGGSVDLADDLVQDTLMLALRHWDRFTPGTHLKSWLLKILHNRFYSLKRRKHVTAEIGRDDLEALSWVPPGQHGALEVEAFRRAFQSLSPAHREVLVLVGVQGLPYEEVARICSCEVGTVKSRVNRARALLKRKLLGEEPAAAPAPAKPAAPRERRAARSAPAPKAAPPVPVEHGAAPGEPHGHTTAPAPLLWLAETEQRIAVAESRLTRCRIVA